MTMFRKAVPSGVHSIGPEISREAAMPGTGSLRSNEIRYAGMGSEDPECEVTVWLGAWRPKQVTTALSKTLFIANLVNVIATLVSQSFAVQGSPTSVKLLLELFESGSKTLRWDFE